MKESRNILFAEPFTMMPFGESSKLQRGCGKLRWLFSFSVASFMMGCCLPPARMAEGVPADSMTKRGCVVVRQIVADSTMEMAAQPIRSSTSLMLETADGMCAVGQGLVGKRLLLPLTGSPPPLVACSQMANAPLAWNPANQPPYECLKPAQMSLYHEGSDALAALEALLDGAHHQIDIVMFIWENDALGRRLACRVAERARAGIRVRILIDGGGTLIYSRYEAEPDLKVNEAVCWLARQPGVQVIRSRNSFVRFDHRKLVLVDGQIAWTGGRNFMENGFFDKHDLSFTITGPLVDELMCSFENSWKEQGGKPQPLPPHSTLAAPANAGARLVATAPLRHDLADAVFQAVDNAKRHIYLENPYISDSRLLLKLAHARRRGVDVRVILSLEGSASVVQHANRVTANRLLNAGVRVYLYPGALHQKAMAVDCCWVYLGTGNFDPLSLRHDRELGVVIATGPIIQEVEQSLFMRDLNPDWEIHQPLPLSIKDRLSEVLASFCL